MQFGSRGEIAVVGVLTVCLLRQTCNAKRGDEGHDVFSAVCGEQILIDNIITMWVSLSRTQFVTTELALYKASRRTPVALDGHDSSYQFINDNAKNTHHMAYMLTFVSNLE